MRDESDRHSPVTAPLMEVEGLLLTCARALGQAWLAVRRNRFTATTPDEVTGGEDAASPED